MPTSFSTILSSTTTTLIVLFTIVSHLNGQTLEWVQQFGTANYETGWGISKDGSGGVYAVGSRIEGEENIHPSQGFISRFDSSGTLLWSDTFGEPGESDIAYQVVSDSVGNAYVGGSVGSVQATAETPRQHPEAFLAKYSPNGDRIWDLVFGREHNDNVRGLALDPMGNLFITGRSSSDISNANYVAKLDPTGNTEWTKYFGGEPLLEDSRGLAVDAFGNAYAVGKWNQPEAEHSELFLRKYDGQGSFLWEQIIDTPENDRAYGVSVDGNGDVVIAGDTRGQVGDQASGEIDILVAKYNSEGHQIWATQFGTAESDLVWDMTTDTQDNILLAGHTKGDLNGENAGESDAHVTVLDSNGNLISTKQIGTEEFDSFRGIAGSSDGVFYAFGHTEGVIGEKNFGLRDFVLAKFVLSELLCDFNADGVCDVSDVDLLYLGGDLITGYSAPNSQGFDLTGDGKIDILDRDNWLLLASQANGVGGYLAGDTDLNGLVEFPDFLSLSANFGRQGGWGDGDFDASGDVDFADFLTLSTNFGQTLSEAATVPEPASGASMTFVVVATLCCRSRRRRFASCRGE